MQWQQLCRQGQLQQPQAGRQKLVVTAGKCRRRRAAQLGAAAGSGVHRPLWKVYYNYRNALRAYRMVAGPVLFWPVLALVFVKWRRRARHAGADRGAYVKLLNLAVKDALRGRRNRDIGQVRALARSLSRDG